jgi:hypothetical protein
MRSTTTCTAEAQRQVHQQLTISMHAEWTHQAEAAGGGVVDENWQRMQSCLLQLLHGQLYISFA